jgi:hypothetical protein
MIRIPRRNPEINADFSPRRRLTGGGIRLNFSDADRALSDLNRAVGQGPRYVQEDVSSGVQAIAKGAQQATSALQELQIRNQDITDKRKLYDGETKLAILQQELQGKLTLEKDPNKWESLAAEHMAAAEFDTEGMSPSAVEALQQYAERTKALTVARARNGGFVENERKYLESANARLQIAEDARNIADVVNIANEIGDTLGQPPEVVAANIIPRSRNIQAAEIRDLQTRVKNRVDVGDYAGALEDIESNHAISDSLLVADKERMVLGVKAAKEDAEFNSAISANPKAELEELLKPDGKYASKPDWQKQDMTFKAAQMMENKSAVTSKRAVNQMVEKTLTKPEQLDQPEFADLTPADKDTLKETLVKGAPNNDQEWMGVAAEINDYTPSDNPDQDALRLAKLENFVEVRFKGAFKDQLVRMIAERRAGETESDAMAKQKLTNYFKEGFLGNYKVPYVAPKDNWFSPDTPGTPLSPADMALTSTDVPEGQRITKGKPVIDIQREAIARQKLSAGLNALALMKKQGKTQKEMDDWVDQYAQQYSIAPALKEVEANSPNPRLPDDMPKVLKRASKFAEGLQLPDGLSETPANADLFPTR